MNEKATVQVVTSRLVIVNDFVHGWNAEVVMRDSAILEIRMPHQPASHGNNMSAVAFSREGLDSLIGFLKMVGEDVDNLSKEERGVRNALGELEALYELGLGWEGGGADFIQDHVEPTLSRCIAILEAQ